MLALLSAGRASALSQHNPLALDYYTQYLNLKDDPVARFEYAQLKLKTAGENVPKIKAGIWDLVLSYRVQDCPLSVRKQIDTLIAKHLAKLDKLIDLPSLNKKEQNDLMTFYLQFKANGSPYESTEDSFKVMLQIHRQYSELQFQERDKAVKAQFYRPKNYKTDVSQGRILLEKPKIGRNDPCYCGSGRKFKQCCGK